MGNRTNTPAMENQISNATMKRQQGNKHRESNHVKQHHTNTRMKTKTVATEQTHLETKSARHPLHTNEETTQKHNDRPASKRSKHKHYHETKQQHNSTHNNKH